METQTISICDAILLSSYECAIKKDILSFIVNNFYTKENSHRLFFICQNDSNIIAIRYCMKCSVIKNLLIYLTETFPLTPPEIYIEKNKKTFMIKPQLSNKLISNQTLEILYDELYFGQWNPEMDLTIKMLSTLTEIFQKESPIFEGDNINDYSGKCILNEKEAIPIIININEVKNINNSIFEQKEKEWPFDEQKIIMFNDKTFLIRELFPFLEKKIDDEDKEIKKKSKELKSIIIKLTEKLNYLDNLIHEMKIQLEQKDGKYQEDVPAPPVACDQDNIYEKIKWYINVENSENIKKYAKIKTHIEMMEIIKEAIQKNVISNDDAIKEIRKCEDVIHNSFINAKE